MKRNMIFLCLLGGFSFLYSMQEQEVHDEIHELKRSNPIIIKVSHERRKREQEVVSCSPESVYSSGSPNHFFPFEGELPTYWRKL